MKAINIGGKSWIIELTAEDIAYELLRQHQVFGCASGVIYRLVWDSIRRRYPKRNIVGWSLPGIEYRGFDYWNKIDRKLEEWFWHTPLHYKNHIFQYMCPCGDLPATLGIFDE